MATHNPRLLHSTPASPGAPTANAAMAGLTRSTPQPINNQDDPLGIGVIGRGMDSYWQGHQQQQQADDMQGNIMAASIHNSGPLPDPNMEGFLQSLKEHNVGAIKAGPSAPGSNQLTGASAMPDATFDPTYNGKVNRNYQSTMFAPGQTSAVTGQTFGQDQQYKQALAGLKGGR